MKRFLIVLIIIIITVICTLFINKILSSKNYYSPIFYQTTVKQSNMSDTSVIENNNLKITLKGFYTNNVNNEEISKLSLDEGTSNNILKYSENNDYNLLLDFSTVDGEQIIEPIFDYFIFDNSRNIIMTSIEYNKEKTETNKFLKYFVKNEYNSTDIHEIDNYNLSSSTTKNIVNTEGNSNLVLISSQKDNNIQKTLDLSRIYVLVINPSYKTTNSDRVYLENSIFEFIVEN